MFLPQSWEGRGRHTAFATAQRASAKALRLTPSWPRSRLTRPRQGVSGEAGWPAVAPEAQGNPAEGAWTEKGGFPDRASGEGTLVSEGALLTEPSGQGTPSLPGSELPVLGGIQRLDSQLRGSDRGNSRAVQAVSQLVWGHPWGVAQVVNNPPANAGDTGPSGSIPAWEDPPERGMAAYSVFSPGESHGLRTLAGYGTRGRRVRRDLACTRVHTHSAGYGFFPPFPRSHTHGSQSLTLLRRHLPTGLQSCQDLKPSPPCA